MFTTADLAKCLFDYFVGRGYSKRQVFLRSNPSGVDLPGSIFVTFDLPADGSEVFVSLESNALGNGYLSFVSNGGVDDFYKSVSKEAKADRTKHSCFLSGLSVVLQGDQYIYRARYDVKRADKLFRALFNECIRPALYYARTHGDKI